MSRVQLFIEPLELRCLLSYRVTDLGSLGGSGSAAYAMNEVGEAVGPSSRPDPLPQHGFFWSAGVMTDVGTLGGSTSIARGVNDLGVVVGDALTTGDAAGHAFLWYAGWMLDLGTLGGAGSAAFDVNNFSQVVGGAMPAGLDYFRPFLWENGVMRDLGALERDGYANAVNNWGWAAGVCRAGNGMHATLWAFGRPFDLGTLGGRSSNAFDVNDYGQVAGKAQLPGDIAEHAFLWDQGVMRDLGTLGGLDSIANSVNDAGQVVGYSFLPGGTVYHAFVWRNGRMTDLNDLLAADTGWVLEVAADINDAGQIAGTGTHRGQTRAFLLTPDPGAAPDGPSEEVPPSDVAGALLLADAGHQPICGPGASSCPPAESENLSGVPDVLVTIAARPAEENPPTPGHALPDAERANLAAAVWAELPVSCA